MNSYHAELSTKQTKKLVELMIRGMGATRQPDGTWYLPVTDFNYALVVEMCDMLRDWFHLAVLDVPAANQGGLFFNWVDEESHEPAASDPNSN